MLRTFAQDSQNCSAPYDPCKLLQVGLPNPRLQPLQVQPRTPQKLVGSQLGFVGLEFVGLLHLTSMHAVFDSFGLRILGADGALVRYDHA